MKLHEHKRLFTVVVAGELLLLTAFVVLFTQVALGDGVSCVLLPVILAGLGAAGGIGFNRLGGEARAPALIAAWLLTLTPLLSVWMFAAMLAPLGVDRAAPTSMDIAFVLLILASLLGALGFLRDEDRRTTSYRAAGFACVAMGVVALVAAVSGQPLALVALALVLAVVAHGASLFALWRAST